MQLLADDYGFDLNGYINLQRNFPHQLKLAWRLRLPSDDELRGEGRFEGDLQKTMFEQQLLAPGRIGYANKKPRGVSGGANFSFFY